MVRATNLDDPSGKRFGRYEVRELLGQGAMGVVYLVYDTSLDREVAVKILSPDLVSDTTNVERFLREAKIAAQLRHPHIVTVHDHGEQDGNYFIVMPYFPGRSLEDRLKARGSLALDEAAWLLEQLAGALDYAHGKGVIHRDVKPNNVMLDEHGDAYLGDFGIAKLRHVDSQLTQTGIIFGTFHYLAPERWRDEEASPASDLYALGILIYKALTGRVPFEAADTPGLMHKHLLQPPPPPQQFRPELPDIIQPVLEKALAKKPADRYPNAKESAEAFKAAVHGGGTTPAPPSAPVPNDRDKRHNTFLTLTRLWMHMAVRLVLVTLLLFGLWYALTIPGVPLPGGISGGQAQIALASTETAIAMLQAESPTQTRTPVSTPPAAIAAISSSTATATLTSTLTASPTPTATATQSPTPRPTITPSRTLTATLTLTRAFTPTATLTATGALPPTAFPLSGSVSLAGTLAGETPVSHVYQAQAGDIITLRLTSDDFDTYLMMQAPSGEMLAENDDCGTVRRSCINLLTLPVNGNYTIVVHSFDRRSTGDYTLDIHLDPQSSPTPTRTTTHTPPPQMTAIVDCPAGSPTAIVASRQGSVNIRSGPGTAYPRVALAYDGECLLVIGRDRRNEWLRIKTVEGRHGWILADLTDIEATQLEDVPEVGS